MTHAQESTTSQKVRKYFHLTGLRMTILKNLTKG